MKALFLDTPSVGKKDMISAFEQCGIEITLFYHDAIRDYPSQAFDAYFDSLAVGESYSFVYSFNYYPAVSNGCMRNGLNNSSAIDTGRPIWLSFNHGPTSITERPE